MNGKCYDIEYFKALAKSRGGRCLSYEYLKLRYKLEWECKEGHIFKLEPQKILSRDYWCPKCTGRRHSHTIETIQEIAQNRGWKFLSPEYSGGNKRYNFQCDKGHIISVIAANVLRGVGCRTCAGKQLLTIDNFKSLAIDKGGVCLSEKYEGQRIKLKFRCKEGHIFEALPNEIKNGGTWCKKCSGLELGTIEEMKDLADSKGGKCLSNIYVNSSTKLKWQCVDNHIWEATPRDIKFKSWCPYCTWYKQETKCRYILENLLNTKFHKTRRVLESRLELDGYSKEYNLAFEYNGEQHYEIDHFFNGNSKKFNQIKKNDQLKLEECQLKGIELITIPYDKVNTDLDTINYIRNELFKRKITFASIEPEDLMKGFYANHSVINEIRKLVEEKNGKLLTNEYLGSRTKLTIECEKSHKWITSYSQLKLRWCPICSGTAKRTIEEMHHIARGKDGKCLSINYINITTPLKWQCKEGHEWFATPSSIIFGTWCLKCSGKAKLTIEDMSLLAEAKGGKCLSAKYINNSTKLKWECAKGHEWEARPQDIKNKNSWCPYCSSQLKRNRAKSKVL